MMRVYLTAILLIATYAAATPPWVYEGQWPDPHNLHILNSPCGVAAFSDTSFYVTDTNGHRVWFVYVNGPQFYWGRYGAGPGEFVYPQGLALSPDNRVFVVDHDNSRVQIFNLSGWFLSSWPTPGFESLPLRIAIAPGGNVYMPFRNSVFYFTPGGSIVGSWGGAGSRPGEFNNPQGVAVSPDMTIYVVDMGNSRVQYFTATGSYLGQWGGYGVNAGQFKNPSGVAVGTDGYVFVTDSGNYRVQLFTRDGSFVSMWGSYGTGPGQFNVADAVSVSPSGNVVYVADRGYSRVQWFRESPSVVTPMSLGRVKALFR